MNFAISKIDIQCGKLSRLMELTIFVIWPFTVRCELKMWLSVTNFRRKGTKKAIRDLNLIAFCLL